MRVLIITFLFSTFGSICFGQIVSESMVNLRKKYNPLFSKESSVLAIDFVREYEINKPDTLYYMIIKVNKVILEQETVSIGTSIFGSGWLNGSSFGASASFKINESEGEMVFSLENLEEFFECANSIYKFIVGKNSKGEKMNTISYCEVGDIILGAELITYQSGITGMNFYFKIGNDVVYKMRKDEFEEIMGTVNQIRKSWQGK
ncbi:MAG TPA: hypothetical protein PKA00_21385 [Saprospiraceae bacterium]|nr:hypothetical protein [Saprospiraceae bacterium]